MPLRELRTTSLPGSHPGRRGQSPRSAREGTSHDARRPRASGKDLTTRRCPTRPPIRWQLPALPHERGALPVGRHRAASNEDHAEKSSRTARTSTPRLSASRARYPSFLIGDAAAAMKGKRTFTDLFLAPGTRSVVGRRGPSRGNTGSCPAAFEAGFAGHPDCPAARSSAGSLPPRNDGDPPGPGLGLQELNGAVRRFLPRGVTVEDQDRPVGVPLQEPHLRLGQGRSQRGHTVGKTHLVHGDDVHVTLDENEAARAPD